MHQAKRVRPVFVLPVMLCLMVHGNVCAQEASIFTPPQAYSIERYESGWNKNPFTLKTAPVVKEQISFAADLAIAAYYGDAEDPTVVVVNTKTGERTQLKKLKTAASGMMLKNVRLGNGRKDIAAEVTLGSETSELRFNDEYVKQLASAEVTKGHVPGSPTRTPPAMSPNQQVKVAKPTTAPPMSPRPLSQGNRSPVPSPKLAHPASKPSNIPVVKPPAKSNAAPVMNPGPGGIPSAVRRSLIAPAPSP